MRRLLLSAGLGLTICVGLVAPAGAQRDRSPVDTAPIDTAPIDGAPVDTAPSDVRPTDVRPTDVRPTDVRPAEVLRVACHGRMSDTGRAAVACEWSPTTRDGAAGYTLIRSNGDTRTTVFSTRDLTVTTAIDSNIRLDVAYTYSILVVDARGNTIGQGGPVTAGVRAPDPEVEVLQLECVAADELLAARCHWRPSTSSPAVGYQLWRIVNRGERELVHRGGLDQTSVGDQLPRNTLVVRYAVLALDADGEIVGQSRPFALRFDNGHGGPTIDGDVDAAPVRPVRLRAHTYR